MTAELPLAGTAALVTGGGSGIGLACARRLVADGASVTIVGRTAARLEAAAADLRLDAPADVVVQHVACDVGDESAVEEAVATASAPRGALHLAVANAGTGGLAPITSTTLDEWNRVLTTNLTGVFLTFKHAGRAIVAGGGGAMVGISSIASPLSHRYMAPYSVSKAGLDTLVQVTADELGRLGVRVNSVRPGLVSTELGSYLESDPKVLADYLDQMPLARVGTVDDVANAVRWLLGPESSWVTGQCLGVDGGHTLRRGPDLEHWARALFGDAEVDITDVSD
jgi:NAD(P)-dependent dehydrogenase (short-subunit alcohol dehydrogenase family)